MKHGDPLLETLIWVFVGSTAVVIIYLAHLVLIH